MVIFKVLFVAFFVTRDNVAFLPFRRKNAYFKHTYTDVVMTMGIKTCDNFSKLSAVKLLVRNLLSVTYLGFVGSLLQFFNKEH